MSHSRQIKKRIDYQAPAYLVSQIELEFVLDPTATQVTATSHYQRQGAAQDLVLDGVDLTLKLVLIDGQPFTDYQLKDEQLYLSHLPEQFSLTIVTELSPAANSALEGLYLSAGAYCTQCEAEGFRRITFYQDRPDVMAVFTTHIIADRTQYPYLLSNGNLIAESLLADGRSKVSWHDPFPKPCYLFALVAGQFDLLEDKYVTASGREVRLQFYVDPGQQQQARFALAALQRAMLFDEQHYGLEYDLDIYMVVAVDFFNMGAMENKGLNIFNSKYVLADDLSATDTDYYHIESIIAHEYFHNWTGNRVTCRDWFQLSLKEGLTVFRDQQFSAAMGSATLCRIDAIKTIRSAQFAEDASPMAHPIRPEQVMEMNNFYTVTVYDKGAEVIRMQHSLLGEAGFRAGMDLYFKRHDGQAVTCDDFVQAMQDANQLDLSQFKRWYSQAGTPVISVQCERPTAHSLRLQMQQHCADSADGSPKLPLHIPVRIELVAKNYQQSALLQLTAEQQTFEFNDLPAAVIPVLLADFSAPVKLEFDFDLSELLFIAANAQDGVARWDAMQRLWSDLIQQALQNDAVAVSGASQQVPAAVIDTFRHWLGQPGTDLAFTAELLTLPSFDSLAEQFSEIPVDALLNLLKQFKQQLAMALADDWLAAYQRIEAKPYQYEPAQVAQRAFKNTCLQYLALQEPVAELLFMQQYQQANNLTDRLAVLQALVRAEQPLALQLLQNFADEYANTAQLFDKHSNLTAMLPASLVYQAMEQQSLQPQFDWKNPNRVRAVYGAFSQLNPQVFHARDGLGYQLLAQVVAKLDRKNPQLAARLVTPLLSWQRYDIFRQQLMKQQLTDLAQLTPISNDLYEKVQRSLN